MKKQNLATAALAILIVSIILSVWFFLAGEWTGVFISACVAWAMIFAGVTFFTSDDLPEEMRRNDRG